MVDDGIDEPLLLAECWQYWAERCATLSADAWLAPTRCQPWDVSVLVDHVAPDPDVLRRLAGSVVVDAGAVTDAAVLLRDVEGVGARAKAFADAPASRDPVALVHRFVDGAGVVLAEPELPPGSVVAHPLLGPVTVGALTTVAVVEATVHYLDLLDAVGGDPLPRATLDYVLDVLVRMSEPAPLIEAVTGRRNPLTWFPLIR
jgi:uncharacterized protein (TIGR03083 family)